MAAKYYTHFLVQEPGRDGRNEYSGIVEVTQLTERPVDEKEIEAILASNLEVETDDITILQYSRIH